LHLDSGIERKTIIIPFKELDECELYISHFKNSGHFPIAFFHLQMVHLTLPESTKTPLSRIPLFPQCKKLQFDSLQATQSPKGDKPMTEIA